MAKRPCKCHLTDRTRNELEQRHGHRHYAGKRTVCTCLIGRADPGDRRQGEHGSTAIHPEPEVGVRRHGAVHPMADAFERRGDGLRGKEARDDDVVLVDSSPVPSRQRVNQFPSVGSDPPVGALSQVRCLPKPTKPLARSNQISSDITYTSLHEQRIPCVLLQHLIRFGVERLGGYIPNDLIDADEFRRTDWRYRARHRVSGETRFRWSQWPGRWAHQRESRSAAGG